jgi:hypothetical protein
MADKDDNLEGPSQSGYWRNVANNIWRENAAKHRALGQDDLAANAMRSASIAALIAARRARDNGAPMPDAWNEALNEDRQVDDYERRGDPSMADYHRNVSLYYALLGLDEPVNP